VSLCSDKAVQCRESRFTGLVIWGGILYSSDLSGAPATWSSSLMLFSFSPPLTVSAWWLRCHQWRRVDGRRARAPDGGEQGRDTCRVIGGSGLGFWGSVGVRGSLGAPVFVLRPVKGVVRRWQARL
jgi:hypothetical protein